jgi:hypothetical protein
MPQVDFDLWEFSKEPQIGQTRQTVKGLIRSNEDPRQVETHEPYPNKPLDISFQILNCPIVLNKILLLCVKVLAKS